MINWKSILSSFNDKPTLLEWLKLVEKALKESVLNDVTINQNGGDIAFTFNFEDGTSITTPKVTLPKGDKGDKGDKGEQGKSVTRFDTIGSEVVGDETLTTIRANYSDSSFSEFIVNAKNGSSGNLFLHNIKIQDSTKFYNVSFNAFSTKRSLTLEDAINLIGPNKIPAVFQHMDQIGTVAISTYITEGAKNINSVGVVYNQSDNNVVGISKSFTPASIVDNLLGENV